MKRREIENKLFEVFEPVVRDAGLELLDVELIYQGKRTVLRVTIYRPEGVTLDDCVKIEKILSPRLDELDPIPGSYNLEVSSPGLERTLRRDKEFTIFKGRLCQVNLFAPVEGRRVYQGVLMGLKPEDGATGNEVVFLETDGGVVALRRKDVSKVQLLYTGEKEN